MNSSYALYATDMPQGFPEVMGGKPWDNVDGLQRENPMFYAKNFKTPTLITHGELDYRVPYGNGLELYGVLQAMNVPTRLVVLVDGCLLLELNAARTEVCRERHPHPQCSTPQLYETARYSDRARHQLH